MDCFPLNKGHQTRYQIVLFCHLTARDKLQVCVCNQGEVDLEVRAEFKFWFHALGMETILDKLLNFFEPYFPHL